MADAIQTLVQASSIEALQEAWLGLAINIKDRAEMNGIMNVVLNQDANPVPQLSPDCYAVARFANAVRHELYRRANPKQDATQDATAPASSNVLTSLAS